MDVAELRERYDGLLVGLVRDSTYPSAAIMQRVERGVRDPRAALEYLEVLIEKCEGESYPSLPLLDRIASLMRQLESRLA